MLVVLGGIFVLHITAIVLLLVATIENVRELTSSLQHRRVLFLSDVSSATRWMTESSHWHVFGCSEASFLCCYQFNVPFRATYLTFLLDRSAERSVNTLHRRTHLYCTCKTLRFPSVLYWVWHTCRMRCRTPRLPEDVHSSFRVSCIRIFLLLAHPNVKSCLARLAFVY